MDLFGSSLIGCFFLWALLIGCLFLRIWFESHALGTCHPLSSYFFILPGHCWCHASIRGTFLHTGRLVVLSLFSCYWLFLDLLWKNVFSYFFNQIICFTLLCYECSLYILDKSALKRTYFSKLIFLNWHVLGFYIFNGAF
jgi:hypothetical protein